MTGRWKPGLLGLLAGIGVTASAVALVGPGGWLQGGPVTSPSASPSASTTEPPSGPRNVILFVGDGMGVETITAARILEGQLRGESGEENALSFEDFPGVALSKTYNVDSQVPDSAGTITALMSGAKTDIGIINVDSDVVRGDCSTVAGNELTTWIMAAEREGLATGVVTTSRLTDATPAGTYAVTPDRLWENDTAVPVGCGVEDIATQLLGFDVYGDGLEVALGGGRGHFLPATAGGARADGRDLTSEWVTRGTEWVYVDQASDLPGLDLASVDHLLGLFSNEAMAYDVDRVATGSDQPSLTQMTLLAITQLRGDPDGFALVIEAGRVDHAHHAKDAYRALTDTIELSNAVRAAIAAVDMSETLVIVTADHGDVLTISGYPGRGSDILGVVEYGVATHSGEDVPVFATGPGSDAVTGVREQSYVGRMIFAALALGESVGPGS